MGAGKVISESVTSKPVTYWFTDLLITGLLYFTPRGTCGYDRVLNLNVVVDLNFWPDRKMVDGNSGRFTESG